MDEETKIRLPWSLAITFFIVLTFMWFAAKGQDKQYGELIRGLIEERQELLIENQQLKEEVEFLYSVKNKVEGEAKEIEKMNKGYVYKKNSNL